MKVLFVDDEILAMEYLQNLIPWEEYGITVVGHARSGKKALELYDKEKPDVVISDIKMAGMDGLELSRKLKEKNSSVVIILLSAYRDFEYAQKGMEYGVSNYLLKHELCEEKLIGELEKVKRQLKERERTKKIYQTYFVKQLIYNPKEAVELEELGDRFFLILIHKDDLFLNGAFKEQKWNPKELNCLSGILEETKAEISYVADVHLTPNNLIVLYKIGKISSNYQVISCIEQTARKIAGALSQLEECRFNLIFSGELKKEEISSTFQKMSGEIRYAVFWKSCCVYDLRRLCASHQEEKISWNDRAEELKKQLYEGNQPPDDFIGYLFELVKYPEPNLMGFRELVHILENLAREVEDKEGLSDWAEEWTEAKIEAVQKYYVERMKGIYEAVLDRASQKYSKPVKELLRYIRRHYDEDLNLDLLGELFQMNGVYLGRIFKKETGETCLKYLTNCRMEEAKRLLDDGSFNVSEVAEKVGYKTSQYFSQVFYKNVGVTPQEYRKWHKER